MKANRMLVLGIAVLALLSVKQARAEGQSIGGGANYWVAVADIDVDNIDKSGFGYYVSYQYKAGLLGLGVDFEMLPDWFGDDAFAPQAYILVGKAIYGGAGVGWTYQNDDFADDPFFTLRAGFDLELLPSIHLDVYGQYRFGSSKDLENEATDIDTDTVYLGAAVRVVL